MAAATQPKPSLSSEEKLMRKRIAARLRQRRCRERKRTKLVAERKAAFVHEDLVKVKPEVSPTFSAGSRQYLDSHRSVPIYRAMAYPPAPMYVSAPMSGPRMMPRHHHHHQHPHHIPHYIPGGIPSTIHMQSHQFHTHPRGAFVPAPIMRPVSYVTVDIPRCVSRSNSESSMEAPACIKHEEMPPVPPKVVVRKSKTTKHAVVSPSVGQTKPKQVLLASTEKAAAAAMLSLRSTDSEDDSVSRVASV